MPPRLGIIIVSYNTRELTRDCLQAVYRSLDQENWTADVWVVDNNSLDGSAEMVNRNFPQTHLVACEKNLGFARANNLAMRHMLDSASPPNYLILLNPDTRVSPKALPKMVSFLEDHENVGVIGPQLSYDDGSFQHSAFRFPNLWMTVLDFWPIHHRLLESRLNGRYPRRLYRRGKPFRIDHPLGAALMIRRRTVEQIGLLDPGFFMYCEEIDWCMRAKSASWQIYCLPTAHVVHVGGQSSAQFRDRMFVALWRSRYRLFEKHYSRIFLGLTRRIVRCALRHKSQQIRTLSERGELSKQEAASRLAAYQKVMEL